MVSTVNTTLILSLMNDYFCELACILQKLIFIRESRRMQQVFSVTLNKDCSSIFRWFCCLATTCMVKITNLASIKLKGL